MIINFLSIGHVVEHQFASQSLDEVFCYPYRIRLFFAKNITIYISPLLYHQKMIETK